VPINEVFGIPVSDERIFHQTVKEQDVNEKEEADKNQKSRVFCFHWQPDSCLAPFILSLFG
jgi:hypothetical protein